MGKNKFITLLLIMILSTTVNAQHSLEEAFPNLSFSSALYLTPSYVSAQINFVT